MSYILNNANGQQLTILNDGMTDNVLTSLTLVGKNVSNFGDAQNTNFLYLLENFANSSVTGGQPRSPITGQTWFDTSPGVNRLLVFDGTSWRPLAVSMYDTSSTNRVINALSNPSYPFASTQPGDFWVDSVNKQLYIVTSTSSALTLVGPESVSGFGTTKMSSSVMYDIFGNPHPVIQTVLNNEVISVFSNATFDSTTTNQLSGFSKIYRGFTFKNYSTSTRYTTTGSDVILYGLHDQLDTSYPRRNLNEHIQGSWYFDYGSQLNFGTNGESGISWNSATSSLSLISNAATSITSNGTTITYDGSIFAPSSPVSLGTPSYMFSNVYSSNITATTIVATNIYENGERVLTAATLPNYGIISVQGSTDQISVTNSLGTVTLTLADSLEIDNLSATNIMSTNIAGSVVTDSGARVITTATLPFSIATITGVSSQISVSLVGRTTTLGFPTNTVMNNVSADSINALNVYENGYQVINTASISSFAVVEISGTNNQITSSESNGLVTLGLPNTVVVNNFTATAATIGTLISPTGNIATLNVNNGTITALGATNANISNSLISSSARIGSIEITGNATFDNDATATNIYASGNMVGYNVRGTYGNFSTQLNAAAASISTLTVTTLKDSFGTGITKIDTDGTFSANSDLNIATQKAIVTYVNALISSAVSQIVPTPPIPAGTVFYTASANTPTGYLVCDGSSYQTSAYPALYSAIGYIYGGSAGIFNVPDLRGQFIRGLDSGRGIDDNRTLGTTQADTFGNHAHYEFANVGSGYGNISSYPNAAPSMTASGDSSGASYSIGTNNNNSATVGLTSHVGGVETRPTNVALIPIIKF